MAPIGDVVELVKRRTVCRVNAYGQRYCYRESRWRSWGRWVVVAVCVFIAVLVIFSWVGKKQMNKRKQNQMNQQYPQGEVQYDQNQYQQQPQYEQQYAPQSYENAGPPSGPPPQAHQGYNNAPNANEKDNYGPPPGPPPVSYQNHP